MQAGLLVRSPTFGNRGTHTFPSHLLSKALNRTARYVLVVALIAHQHRLVRALNPGTNDPKLAIREAPSLNIAIAKGWSVAIPDHLGPPRAYGAAKLGGQITLDGMRAARRFDALGLGASPVGMADYFGGGMATAMAAAIAPTYALRTRTRRPAPTAALAMNIDKMAKALGQQKHPAFGLAMADALGLEREYLRPYADHESAQRCRTAAA